MLRNEKHDFIDFFLNFHVDNKVKQNPGENTYSPVVINWTKSL
jgi:hypothetical protein